MIDSTLTSLVWLLPLLASSQVIVGKQWPHPRWFINTGGVIPANGVVADTIAVVADGVQVVAS